MVSALHYHTNSRTILSAAPVALGPPGNICVRSMRSLLIHKQTPFGPLYYFERGPVRTSDLEQGMAKLDTCESQEAECYVYRNATVSLSFVITVI